jgi:hypothetical protein
MEQMKFVVVFLRERKRGAGHSFAVLDCKTHDTTVSFGHLISHHIAVNVECGSDVCVPHHFLLDCDRSSCRVKP